MVGANTLEKRFDVRVDRMIASDRNAAAAAVRHLPGALIDRARNVIRGRSAVEASAGHVDGGPGNTKLEGNAAARAAAGAGDQSDDVLQVWHRAHDCPLYTSFIQPRPLGWSVLSECRTAERQPTRSK